MNTQIYENATNWLIKHREADLDAQEKRDFDAWLRESPQHVRAYLEMSAVWEDVPALDPGWNPTPDQLVARARNEENIHLMRDRALANTSRDQSQVGHGDRQSRPAFPSRTMRPFALAATVLILIGSAALWSRFNRYIYTTDIGEQRSIVLTDGSTVELNSRSRVRIRYTETQRDVDLIEGQALFNVTHNIARPFVVHSGTVNVRAVGTQFDVYRKQSDTIVTVVEGRVAVAAKPLLLQERAPSPEPVEAPAPAAVPRPVPNAAARTAGRPAIILAAGEQITIPVGPLSGSANSADAYAPQSVNIAAATAWTHHTLLFESSPLVKVAEEFNRYNTRQVVIADPDLENIHISGIFSSSDPALLLKFLRTQSGLRVEETGMEIRISKQ